MKDVKFTNGDIDLSGGVVSFVTGPEYVAQKIEQRLRFLQGEWALDVSLGFPWPQEVLGKRITPERLDALIRQALLTILQVRSVTKVDISGPDINRAVTVAYEVVTTAGEIISGGVPFVVQ